MNCLEVRSIKNTHVIQRFYFNNKTDLNTFQFNSNFYNVYKDLICDDVDMRIKQTKQIFKPSYNVKNYSIENTDVFDTYVWRN